MPYCKLSVFDLDQTLIFNNSSFRYCFALVKSGVLPISYLFISIYYYLRHRFGRLPLAALHEKIFQKLLKGLPLKSLEDGVDEFILRFVSKRYYFPAIERLKLAQNLGHYTVILSNSIARHRTSKLGYAGLPS